MIRNHPMRGFLRTFRTNTRQVSNRADECRKEIDRIIVMSSLQNGRDALEPHSCVYRRTRQIYALSAWKLLVLHEDEVPDLDETISFGVGRAWRAAGNVRAVIVKNFRTRAAWAGLTHGPEIIVAGNAQYLAVRKPGNLLPELKSVIIVDIDGDEQLVPGQRVFLGHQIPRKLDRPLLEVVSEGEVTEHLEEGMMPCGIPDIVEVVVLAARAYAFLCGHGARIRPLLQPREDILELHHPCIGEHQGRIIARHQRRRRHHLVIVAREEIEEAFADIVDAAHFRTVRTSFAYA